MKFVNCFALQYISELPWRNASVRVCPLFLLFLSWEAKVGNRIIFLFEIKLDLVTFSPIKHTLLMALIRKYFMQNSSCRIFSRPNASVLVDCLVSCFTQALPGRYTLVKGPKWSLYPGITQPRQLLQSGKLLWHTVRY